MNLTKGLASLVEMQPLETIQEGLLRGGFAMITTSESSMGAINKNCDCDLHEKLLYNTGIICDMESMHS